MSDRVIGGRGSGASAGLPAWPMLLGGAIVLLAWDAATWFWHIAGARWVTLPDHFFTLQDRPVLIGLAVALLALIPLAGPRTAMPGRGMHAVPNGWVLVFAGLLVIVAARIGRDLVFHSYGVSRDEAMVELAAGYLAQGRIGWPVPPEWQAYARAMVPEFYSPYGADAHWTAIYLPVHAAIRALFLLLGDGDWAAPATLGAGLLALWDVAKRLFPVRRDARIVVMLMALTSTQLLATAMTPYAMTSHFALNMVWLALVLRGGAWANGAAAAVLVLAAGLHQWHFPILFAGPLILWLLWRGEWRTALFQAGALAASVIIWARLWPMLLAALLGAPAAGTAGAAPGIPAKIASLFGRMEKWQPLLNIARLVAWNNPLLMPLAAMAVACVPVDPRRWLRDPPIILPFGAIVLIGLTLALYQGYGWGFRYMHGQLGALCLLAGYGWTALSREGQRPLRLVWAASALSMLATIFLLGTTERYVRGYARTMAAIRSSDADAVLVDLRGGFFMTDLVRFEEGRPGRPAVMALAMMTRPQIRALCASHRVAIMDHGQFWALGVHRVSPVVREGPQLDALRRELDRLGCAAPVLISSR